MSSLMFYFPRIVIRHKRNSFCDVTKYDCRLQCIPGLFVSTAHVAFVITEGLDYYILKGKIQNKNVTYCRLADRFRCKRKFGSDNTMPSKLIKHKSVNIYISNKHAVISVFCKIREVS
jgi:hypothetical protein